MQHQTLQNLVGRADALINAGQFDALMDFYCDDATLVVKPGLNACGKAQIRQAFDAIARHFEHSLRVRQHDLRVIEAGDTALVMAEAVIESKAGRLQRRATYVFRQGGRWPVALRGGQLLRHRPAGLGGGERGGQPMSASTLSASKPLLAGYVESILAAPVYDVAVETPLQVAPQLSQRLGNRVLLKREDLQPVFSFKIRGAYTRVARLSDEQKARGVITASAGNHAQGLALAAQRLGVRAVIVMPRTTPELKVKGVLARGGEALLHGDAFPDALAHALQLAEREGMTFVPPYDDPDVIAGQGTVAMEILRQHSGRLDAIFVPVGGGSLIARIAAYVKHLRPDIRVIGVEPEDSNCLRAALAAGERVVLGQVGLFADGVAVAQIGACNFEVCKDHVDEVITVGSDEICAAIKDIYDDTRSITEPAGAPGRKAGIKKYVARERTEGQTLVAIDSGANINFDRLRHVAERAELGEQREAIIAVTVAERPGSFKAFCAALGRRQITEFNYRYHSDRQATCSSACRPIRSPTAAPTCSPACASRASRYST